MCRSPLLSSLSSVLVSFLLSIFFSLLFCLPTPLFSSFVPFLPLLFLPSFSSVSSLIIFFFLFCSFFLSSLPFRWLRFITPLPIPSYISTFNHDTFNFITALLYTHNVILYYTVCRSEGDLHYLALNQQVYM